MPAMTRIPSDLAAFGLKVETVPGWETRSAGSIAPAGVVCHWTAGPANSRTRPSLNVVIDGRPGLSGPLCNVYLARDGACVVVAAGRANHAGTGSWKGLVGNSAVYGIEAEAAGPSDWTDAQRQAYPRLVAALLHGLGRDASWACGHSEWAGPRKVDINGWPLSAMRSQVAALLATHGERDWFDMATKDELRALVTEAVTDVLRTEGVSGAGDARVMKERGYAFATKGDVSWVRDQVGSWLGVTDTEAASADSEVLATVRAIAAPDTVETPDPA